MARIHVNWRFVASAATTERLLLPDAADLKEKFDLEATAQAAA